jgi:hypothetical protein
MDLNLVPDWQISEDDVAEHAPRVRGQVVKRYEDLWQLITTQIHLAEEAGRPVDPRWAELGVRVTKELASVYRLHRVANQELDEVVLTTPVDVIEAQLKELEAKLAG